MVFGKRRGRLVVEVAFVEVEIVVVGIIVEVVDSGVHVDLVGERRQVAAFAFGGTAETFPAVDESAYADHVEQVVLFFRRYVCLLYTSDAADD